LKTKHIQIISTYVFKSTSLLKSSFANNSFDNSTE